MPIKLYFTYENKIAYRNLSQLEKHQSGWTGFNTDLSRLQAGRAGAVFWSAYVNCKDFQIQSSSVRDTLAQIDLIHRLVERNPSVLEFAKTAADISRIHRTGKIASLIGVEGGHSIDGSLETLRMFYRLGVRYLTLTHSCHSDLADSCTPKTPFHNGLSPFGHLAVKEMNRLGIMVDLAHVSADTMRDAIRVSEAPVIFSHSSAYGICNHPRNVPDDVLESLKDRDGIVMVNFYSGYLSNTTRATLDTVVQHIAYISRIAGVEKVGFGSDFDGVELFPVGLEDVSKYPNLVRALLEYGFTTPQVRGFTGDNFLRVMKRVEEVASRSVSRIAEELLSQNKTCL
ncbi:MAG: hypothetical protein SGCHY_003558 [Lobulomycetales sp.]